MTYLCTFKTHYRNADPKHQFEGRLVIEFEAESDELEVLFCPIRDVGEPDDDGYRVHSAITICGASSPRIVEEEGNPIKRGLHISPGFTGAVPHVMIACSDPFILGMVGYPKPIKEESWLRRCFLGLQKILGF